MNFGKSVQGSSEYRKNMKNTMKRILLVTLAAAAILLCGCKRDRVDYNASPDYLYVWKYSITGDSTLHKYHKPVKHVGIVVEKRKWTTKRPARVGKMTTLRTVRHYRVDYSVDGKGYTLSGYDTYSKVKEGDRIILMEFFYPRHYTKFIGVKR